MQRREFLSIALLLPTLANSSSIQAKAYQIIEAVIHHMFAHTRYQKAIYEANIIGFISTTINHHSYDKDIKAFILHHSLELDRVNNHKFLDASFFRKELMLRSYERYPMGQNWLYEIQTLAFEAIFSAPIYGVNVDKKFWKLLGTEGGKPLPTKRYIDV
jgi:hypothetical protein